MVFGVQSSVKTKRMCDMFVDTDLNKISPTIEWNDGEMSLQWSKPRHLGGPITKFEIMLKKNGEQLTDDDDFPRVNFREGMGC